MAEKNPNLAFVLPKEGSNLFADAMCIPKGAEHKENAEAFINFMCSTEAGLANALEVGYSTPLLSVREALDAEGAADPISYPDSSVLAKCESYVNLPQELLDFYDSEWLRLKN
ncbi:Spermidine-binding periplasmic protein SpuE [bioreactor metagenome]|uniref:Spermidine-binding periplasmic protein SpuE n=1 Tax=bioreactor metagenome TaxID=1076179 RepID=A0A645JWH5_9ZZZZ